MLNTLRVLAFSASLHLTIFERPAQNGNLRRQRKKQTAYVCLIHCASWLFPLPCISPFLNGLLKTAICGVSGKSQTAYVCLIHCASWLFPLPFISPFLNGLLKTAICGVSEKSRPLMYA